MSQSPTRVEAVQVQPGVPAFVDAGKLIVGAVSVGTQIFVVTAEYDLPDIPPPASPATPPAAPERTDARDPEEAPE